MSFKTSNYNDREKYRKISRGMKERYRKRTGASQYERRVWTQFEEQILFDPDLTDREISVRIKRSVGAIQKHRWQLRKRGYDGYKTGSDRTSGEVGVYRAG